MTTAELPTTWTHRTSEQRSPELRQDRAVRTRTQILTAAAALFSTAGFRGTSVLEVAKRAEVTKGAVYFHFPTKEILAVAVVEEHYARWPALLAELAADGLSPLDTAMAMLDRAAVSFRDDVVVRAGARLQIERTLIDISLPVPYVGWIDLVTELLEQAAAAGQLRPGTDPGAVARVLISGFFGLQHISETLHQRADIIERWQELRDLVLLSARR